MTSDDDGQDRFWQRVKVTLMPEPTSQTMLNQTMPSQMGLIFRAVVLLVISCYTLSLFGGISENKGQLLHLVNLPFHEAGHVFFGWLPPLMTSLGGTLMQLLMPLICAFVLLFQQRDGFGASVAMWWLGENFVDIAPYIKDASVGEMVLIGGNTGNASPYGFHDWQFILTETGLIAHDSTIAMLSYVLGCLLMLGAIGWGVLQLYWYYRLYQEADA